MRYKCINAVGYKARLTEGKIYFSPLILPVPGDLVTLVFDDGSQGEVFKDRFEQIRGLEDHPIHENMEPMERFRQEYMNIPYRYDDRVFPDELLKKAIVPEDET